MRKQGDDLRLFGQEGLGPYGKEGVHPIMVTGTIFQ